MASMMGTKVTRVIAMTDTSAGLYKLMTWLSPAFPVGAYSHSGGLENAVAAGLVRDRAAMQAWLADILRAGILWSDAVIFARAYDASRENEPAKLLEICKFANAFPGTAELRIETNALGRAFAEAARQAWGSPALELIASAQPPYPVGVAVAAAEHGIGRLEALDAFLHAGAANLVSAAVRLVPLGQSDGVAIIADIEGLVHAAAEKAATTRLDDLTTACLTAEIASMRHETQKTRLFRT